MTKKDFKPSAKRLGKFNNDWENFEVEVIVKISEKNYRKLQAISAVNNFSFQKIISPVLNEKIMDIDVGNYVEDLPNIDLDVGGIYSFSSNVIKNVKISSEAHRRLIIFAGVKDCSLDDFLNKYVDEIINNIDLVKLVKEEFN